MHNCDYIILQKGEKHPLFVSTNLKVDSEDLYLYVFKDDSFVKTDYEFVEAGDKLYKTIVNFKDEYKQIQIKHKDKEISRSLLYFTDTVSKLVKIETGNWEIKDKQMIFTDKDNNEIMRFNLFDRDGNPSNFNVMKRELV